MSRTFLQTAEWLDFQKSLGRKVWHFDDGKIRANIIKHDLPLKKSYLYIPHGPEIIFDEIKSGLSNELKNFIGYLKKNLKPGEVVMTLGAGEADKVGEGLLSTKNTENTKTLKHIKH